MGPGAVYSFSKFFPGKMTETCQETDFEPPPCPEELADVMYTPDGGDVRSLFGHTLASSRKFLFFVFL